ncbi:MAG: signal peptidase II [Ignavibacteria bacterium]|jgi:signal peptidase II
MIKIKFSEVVLENKKQIMVLFILLLSLMVLDQVTKALAQKYLENLPGIMIIPGFISLDFVRNEITNIHQYILYFIISFIVFPVIIFNSIAKPYSKTITFGLVLLWCAVISNNIIDTFSQGYISDFIKLHGVATGNIADQYKIAGSLLILVGLLKKDKEKLNSKIVLKILIGALILLTLMIFYWRYLAKLISV